MPGSLIKWDVVAIESEEVKLGGKSAIVGAWGL